MAADIRIVLEGEDKLTPDLKKALTNLQELDKEILDVDKSLDKLKAEKKGIVSGAIESDIDSVKKLQVELKKLEAEKRTKERPQSVINRDISKQKARIEAEYTREINKQRAAQRRLNKERVSGEHAANKLLRGTKKLTEATKESTAIRNKATTSLVRHIRQLESMAVAFYAGKKAMDATVGLGIQLNKQYEDSELGLAALIAAKTSDITTTGQQVDAYTKLKIAQHQTKDILQEIKEAALETPASFAEMTGFYQQAIGHALAANKAFGSNLSQISTNVIKFTQRVSNLGAAMGMEMRRIDEEIRSLMSGEASADSMLAKVLFGSPGQANRAIKEAKKHVGGLTKLMDEALKTFDALAGERTYTKLVAKMNAAYQDIIREGSKQIFEDLKDMVEALTKFMVDNKENILNFLANLRVAVVEVGKVVSDIFTTTGTAVKSLAVTINEVVTSLTSLGLGTVFSKEELDLSGLEITVSFLSVLRDLLANTVNGARYLYADTLGQMSTFSDKLSRDYKELLIDLKMGYIHFIEWLNKHSPDWINKISTSDVRASLGETHREKLALDAAIKKSEAATKKETDALVDQIYTLDQMNERAGERVAGLYKSTEAMSDEERAMSIVLSRMGQLKQGLTGATEETDKLTDSQKELNKILETARGDVPELTKVINEYLKAVALMDEAGTSGKDRELVNTYFTKKITTAYEKTDSQVVNKKFEEEYKKTTQDRLTYETEKLNEQYMKYDEFVKDKSKLDEWYMAKYKELGTERENTELETLKNIENAVNGVFKNLEDALVEFTESGKFNMNEMVNAMLKDLSRLIIQMGVIQPLAKSVTAGIGGFFGTTAAQGAAINNGRLLAYSQGGVVNNVTYGNTTKFASGGIVSSPTLFPMASGAGLMGEAGPEAIMPLERTSGGDLGVKVTNAGVTVNVINNAGVGVSTQQDNAGNIDIVLDRVADSIVRGTGSVGSAMESAYPQLSRG